MNNRQRYNWDGMSEQIREELCKDYKRKQTIKGIKKAVGIILAIGIGTVGTYEFIHSKIEEAREKRTEITTTNTLEENLEFIHTTPTQTTTPEPTSFVPIITYAPRRTQVPTQEPTNNNAVDKSSKIEQVYNRIPRNKQIKSAMQMYQQNNPNALFSNYSEFERLLETTNPEERRMLAEQGFTYFMNMERKLLVAYVGDSVPSMYLDAKHIKATYERHGEQYEFHIRYTNTEKPITIARPILERDGLGHLVYAEGTSSNLPIELYERLIFIGEHSKYLKTDGTGIDIEKYAQEHTGGDVEKAVLEIQEKLIAENDALFQLIEDKYIPKERMGEER